MKPIIINQNDTQKRFLELAELRDTGQLIFFGGRGSYQNPTPSMMRVLFKDYYRGGECEHKSKYDNCPNKPVYRKELNSWLCDECYNTLMRIKHPVMKQTIKNHTPRNN